MKFRDRMYKIQLSGLLFASNQGWLHKFIDCPDNSSGAKICSRKIEGNSASRVDRSRCATNDCRPAYSMQTTTKFFF